MRAKTKGKHEIRKRFAIVIGVAAALLAGLAGLATAKSTSDPENDSCRATKPRDCDGKPFDFVKVSADHSGANLVFKAKVRGGAKWFPLLSISTDKAKDSEYYIGQSAKNGVVNCDTGAEAPAKYVGKIGERGFKFVFSPDSIGNPNKYRWQFAYLPGGDRHLAGDTAPNKPDVYPCPG